MNSFEIRAPLEKNRGWVFRALLTSDRHIDHPDSDWDLQKRHLDEAAAIGAPVIDAGDLLCVMQGKTDKRATKSWGNSSACATTTSTPWWSPPPRSSPLGRT